MPRPKDKYAAFWQWFTKNEAYLFDFEDNVEEVLGVLAERFRQVAPGLVFEVSVVVDGKRELTISADGLLEYFPEVEALFQARPELRLFNVVKFRQREPWMNVEMEGVRVTVDDVRYLAAPRPGRVDLKILIRGFRDTEGRPYVKAAFVMLDHALGEYDMETKVGRVHLASWDDPHFEYSRPLKELPGHFDSLLWEQGN
jgi:hypothetical protein